MKRTDDSNRRGTVIRMGMAWYREDQWERLRKISKDVDDLQETFEEWLVAAEDGLKKLRALGVEAERVDVDVDELVVWCKQRRKPVNGSSRSEFVAGKIRRKCEEKSGS